MFSRIRATWCVLTKPAEERAVIPNPTALVRLHLDALVRLNHDSSACPLCHSAYPEAAGHEEGCPIPVVRAWVAEQGEKR